MGKISFKDFVDNVNTAKNKLIEHCKENAISIPDNVSFDQVITLNDTINNQTQGFKVTFVDIDATIIDEQFVQYGGSARIPNIQPNFDEQYLEFGEWIADGDLSNVTQNIVALPEYKVKADEDGKDWAVLKIRLFKDSGLGVTLKLDNNNGLLYINWGDGNSYEVPASSSIQTATHTYSTYGKYDIKIYGTNSFKFMCTSNALILGSVKSTSALTHLYLSNNLLYDGTLFNNLCRSCINLQVLVLPTNRQFETANYFISDCKNLKTLLLNNLIDGSSSNFIQNSDIKYMIIKGTFTTLPYIGSIRQLTHFTIPNNVVELTNALNIYSLSDLNISQNLQLISTNFVSAQLDSLILPESLTAINKSMFSNNYRISTLYLPKSLATCHVNAIRSAYGLNDLILPQDWNFSIDLRDNNALTDTSIIAIAKSLKDNSGLAVKTITFSKGKNLILNSLFINKNTEEQTKEDDENAISLIEFIRNKNWTVAFG